MNESRCVGCEMTGLCQRPNAYCPRDVSKRTPPPLWNSTPDTQHPTPDTRHGSYTDILFVINTVISYRTGSQDPTVSGVGCRVSSFKRGGVQRMHGGRTPLIFRGGGAKVGSDGIGTCDGIRGSHGIGCRVSGVGCRVSKAGGEVQRMHGVGHTSFSGSGK